MKKIVVFLLILYTVACSKKDLNIFSAGSYAFAERYIINNTEQEVIDKIKLLKEQNPNLIPPKLWNGNPYTLKDEKYKFWYLVYIYIEEENRVISFYIRGDWQPTTIGLFAATMKNNLNNWKEINNELEESDNKKIILWFEENILKKLEDENTIINKEDW